MLEPALACSAGRRSFGLGFFSFGELKNLQLQWNLGKLKTHKFSSVFFSVVRMKETWIKDLKVGLFLLETEKAWLNCFSDINAFKKNNIY